MATTREIREAILDDWYTREVPIDKVLDFETTFELRFETWSCVEELPDGSYVDTYAYGRRATLPA